MHDERYFIEINPFDKIEEIVEVFKMHSPQVFSKTDIGYDWLEEDDSKCIVFSNPYGGESLEIAVGDRGEFTLYYNGHAHYANYQYDYDLMLERMRYIFDNSICAGTLTDSKGKWYGSGYFERSAIAENPEQVFKSVFEEKEFYNHLVRVGYIVKYTFWNSKDDKTIQEL